MAANFQEALLCNAGAVLSKSDAAAVLDAVRETRGARSTVTVVAGAATAPLRRHHHFKFGFTGGVVPYEMEGEGENVKILKVALAETGELVPATSLCQFVRQAASESLEVYREIQRRGLRMPRELPIDAPYKEAVGTFTGIDKGMVKWRRYNEQDLSFYPWEVFPGEPTGRILSFLVDAAAIAALAERQASADAAARSLSPALSDDALGGVLPFVGALPRTDEEAIAFLRGECSTACGGAGADGTYLEVAESEDPTKGRLLAEVILFSTREGEFSYVGTLSEEEPREDHYVFAAAGSSEPVVSMASERVKLHHEFLKRACARLAAGSAELRIPRRAAAPPLPGSDEHLAEIDEAFEALGPPPPPHPSEASLAAAFAALSGVSAPAPAPDDGYDASLEAMF
jgi:hypothetical protein